MKSVLWLSACLLAFAAAAHAAFPIEDMDSRSLGIQYGLSFRGQNITQADIPSYETIHTLNLAYAPVPYAAIEAGIGLDQLRVAGGKSAQFHGEFGVAPTFGLILASPHFFSEWLRFTAGSRFLYLNSGDAAGFRYSGLITNPFLGAVLSPSGFFDCEAGVRAHHIDGTMRGPAGLQRPFSNRESLRGYLGFTVKSPRERAFLSLDADVSPGLDSDWSRGPREAQIGVSFGALLGWRRSGADAGQDSSKYFPDFPSMRERLKQMAGDAE
ncbi:MAG TPA: hypothetical protein VJ385_22725 [Fibrobacteria bacterium]|nr:hypothetical protein [Fibrobacteria bacterium]